MLIGNLLYLTICTRPDILFSVSKAAIKKINRPKFERLGKYSKDFKIF